MFLEGKRLLRVIQVGGIFDASITAQHGLDKFADKFGAEGGSSQPEAKTALRSPEVPE